MNRLSAAERTRVIALLVEGMAQRAIVRVTGTCKKAVARLAVEVGEAPERPRELTSRAFSFTCASFSHLCEFPLAMRGNRERVPAA